MIEAKPDFSVAEDAARERSSCAVKVPIFEGPLDLLLHLVRVNEVDIGDIPIALISEQYLEYLELMRLLDIDIAAEYLLMAATLAHIKSRMLLPRDPLAEEQGDDIDPRAELARRLAEYAVFREAAQRLDELPRLGRDVFPGEIDRSQLSQPEAALSVSLVALVDAMRRVLAELPDEERHHQVARAAITAQDCMIAVMDCLRSAPGTLMRFEELLREGEFTRHRILMTFLAVLELTRIQVIRIFQHLAADGRPVGPIWASLAVEAWDPRSQLSGPGAGGAVEGGGEGHV